MKEKYVPINCDFYDEIELRALRGSQCVVIFKNENNEATKLQGIIQNVYAKNKEEFMEMKTGETIRLDQLISIDGKLVPKSC